jgi:hypothetical protein
MRDNFGWIPGHFVHNMETPLGAVIVFWCLFLLLRGGRNKG